MCSLVFWVLLRFITTSTCPPLSQVCRGCGNVLYEQGKGASQCTTHHSYLRGLVSHGGTALKAGLCSAALCRTRVRVRRRLRWVDKGVARDDRGFAILPSGCDQQYGADLSTIRRVCSEEGRAFRVGASHDLTRRGCEVNGGRGQGAVAGSEDDGGLGLGSDFGLACSIGACHGHGDGCGRLGEDLAGDNGRFALRVCRLNWDGHNDGARCTTGWCIGWCTGWCTTGGGAAGWRRWSSRATSRRWSIAAASWRRSALAGAIGRSRVLPLLQVLHSSYDEPGSERWVLVMHAFDTVTIRLEDAVLEVLEAVQRYVQRLFWECIQQILKSLVRA